VIGALAGVGVESYRVDFLSGEDLFYMPDGQTHTEALPHAPARVADYLDAPALQALIRDAQADRLRYPQFVERSVKLGVAAYHVYLNGKKVVYFGRSGEMHTEHFPQ
jgi:uncharacterized protein YbcV (DUF1398 family)